MEYILKIQRNCLNIWKLIQVDERTVSMDTIIIGAGAAGLTAAIYGAKNGEHVTVMEHENKPAKKILITGNGRCNLTNENMNLSCFYGDKSFISNVLSVFDENNTIEFFESLGLRTTQKNGYIYPKALQASAVALALRNKAISLGVKIKTNNEIRRIEKKNDKFVVDVGFEFICDKLIIATGGMTMTNTGSDGSGYDIAKKLGHKIIEPKPALTALVIKDFSLKQASGVRTKGKVELDNVHKQHGEIQITEYGLSGIPVFQLSAYGADILSKNRPGDVKIITDFLPHHSKDELYGMVDRWSESFGNRKLKDFFGGILNGKVVAFIARKLSMAADKSVAKVDKSRLYNFVDYAKECEFNITGSAGFDIAQVTSGGVNLSEINPETCESKIVENLYFAGEIMDVDGPCGGYNLHFAWSSGIAAGKSVH